MNKMQQRLAEKRANEETGFTLIELLVVIVILGILAAVVVFSVRGIQDRGTKSACGATASAMTTAEEAYYAKNGAYAPVASAGTDLVAGGFINANGLTVAAGSISNGLASNAWTITRTAPTATAGPVWTGCPA